MTDNVVSAAVDTVHLDLCAWFDDPVLYEGLHMRRHAAFQLAKADHLGLAEIERINNLPTVQPPGRLLTAAEAFERMVMAQPAYTNPGRDF